MCQLREDAPSEVNLTVAPFSKDMPMELPSTANFAFPESANTPVIATAVFRSRQQQGNSQKVKFHSVLQLSKRVACSER